MSGFLVCQTHPNEAFTSECPACLKLQLSEVKAERDRHFQENIEGVSKRHELFRLNDEYRKALEHISTMDSRVEPMSWSGAFAEAVLVSKDALSEKRICDHQMVDTPAGRICSKCHVWPTT